MTISRDPCADSVAVCIGPKAASTMGSGYHHSLQLMLVNLQSAWHYVKSPDASASAGPAGGDA